MESTDARSMASISKIGAATLARVAQRTRRRATETRTVMMLTTYSMPLAMAWGVYRYIVTSAASAALLGDQTLAALAIRSSAHFAVLIISVYMLQFLSHFTRYGFRIADHLEAVADALELSEGDAERLPVFIDALLPRHIGFGRPPVSPTDRALEAVKDVVGRIRTG